MNKSKNISKKLNCGLILLIFFLLAAPSCKKSKAPISEPVVDPVTIQVTSSIVSNAQEPSTNGRFKVSFQAGYTTTVPTTITYQISGTAVNGTDYASLSGSVIIPAASEFAHIDVLVSDDLIVEGDETIALSNISATNSLGASFTYTGLPVLTIKDNDVAAPAPASAETYASLIKDKTNLIKTLTTNVTYKLYDGVEETHITYTDAADKPMAIFFLTVDLTKDGVSLEVATPNDGTDLNAKQNVTSQITHKNASHTNLEVIAAVNGDYWRVSTTETDPTPLGQPYGLVYKKGVALKESTKNGPYYYFSIQKDGSAYFGAQADALKANIKEGLGGRYLLVQGGVEKPDALGYNTNIEPRTAVGMLNSKRVVFLVVDGRAPTYSQGLTMSNLAKIFGAIGATEAVNMDGGGSTTLAVKNGSTYQVKNKPSDGTLRSVASAWTVMGKKP